MSSFNLNPSALANLERIGEEVRARVLREVAADAQRFAPVDTGELKGSVHVEGNSVVADADHAVYVELGTRHMAAQPYLAPALYRKRNLRAGGA